jgi:hypothetical protein
MNPQTKTLHRLANRMFGVSLGVMLGVMLGVVFTLVLALAAIAPAQAHERDDDDDEDSSYAIGLWGDLPYAALQASVGVLNLIADMNAQRLKFTVHDGDLKAGANSPCDDKLCYQALGF